MKGHACLFNGFLWVFVLAAATGCGTTEERQRKKELSTLRIHVESNSQVDKQIEIIRSSPIRLNIDPEPVLDETQVLAATVVEQPGGFAVEIQFNRQGRWRLEGATVMNRSKHFAIFSQFGQNRWLAAPEIRGKNSTGRLTFTPDASREEAERFVRGLNNLVRKMERKENWPFPAPMDQ